MLPGSGRVYRRELPLKTSDGADFVAPLFALAFFPITVCSFGLFVRNGRSGSGAAEWGWYICASIRFEPLVLTGFLLICWHICAKIAGHLGMTRPEHLGDLPVRHFRLQLLDPRGDLFPLGGDDLEVVERARKSTGAKAPVAKRTGMAKARRAPHRTAAASIRRTTALPTRLAGYPANGGAIDDRSARAVVGAARKFRGSNTVRS